MNTSLSCDPDHRRDLLAPDNTPTVNPAIAILVAYPAVALLMTGIEQDSVPHFIGAGLLAVIVLSSLIRSIMALCARDSFHYRVTVMVEHYRKVNTKWEYIYSQRSDEAIVRQAAAEITRAQAQAQTTTWEKRRQVLKARFGMDPMLLIDDATPHEQVDWDDERLVIKAAKMRTRVAQ